MSLRTSVSFFSSFLMMSIDDEIIIVVGPSSKLTHNFLTSVSQVGLLPYGVFHNLLHGKHIKNVHGLRRSVTCRGRRSLPLEDVHQHFFYGCCYSL